MEMGTMAASDVPWARGWPMWSTRTSGGTISPPPPTPNRPDRNPAARPTSTIFSRPASAVRVPPSSATPVVGASSAGSGVASAAPGIGMSSSVTGWVVALGRWTRPSGRGTSLPAPGGAAHVPGRRAPPSPAVAPEGTNRREHLLIVRELDDVAVRVLEGADVADVLGHLAWLPVQDAEVAPPRRDGVDVGALRHLDADVGERGQRRDRRARSAVPGGGLGRELGEHQHERVLRLIRVRQPGAAAVRVLVAGDDDQRGHP